MSRNLHLDETTTMHPRSSRSLSASTLVRGGLLGLALLASACAAEGRPSSSGGGGVDDPDDVATELPPPNVVVVAHRDDTIISPDGGTDADTTPGGATQPPEPAPVCAKNAVWAAPAPVLADLGAAAFATMTADELSFAWVTGSEGNVTVHVVDRADTATPFGAEQTITGAYAFDRVALTSDGLRIFLVTDDRRHAVEQRRENRGDAFGDERSGSFAELANYADTDMPAGEKIGDLVLAADDRTLIYSQFDGASAHTIRTSFRIFANDSWPVGTPIPARPELDATGQGRRRPMGISADRKTLFYWDETTNKSRAAWTNKAPDDFSFFVTLGDATFAAPNAACDRLYVGRVDGAAIALDSTARQ